MLTTPHSDEVLSLGFFGCGTYYGIELEFEFENQNIEQFITLWKKNKYDLEKYFVLTTDQSLQNGIEIVSCPMSFYYHYHIMRTLFQWLCETNIDLQSNDRTGMHIHIQKEKAIDNLNWLISYIQNNNQEIDLLAGREENHFCLRMFEEEKYLYSKSSAIRVTNNTIEIRIFRTPTNAESIIQILGIMERILSTT